MKSTIDHGLKKLAGANGGIFVPELISLNSCFSGGSRPSDNGGGGWEAGYPDPEIRRGQSPKKKICPPFGPQFGLKIRCPDPSPGFANVLSLEGNV